MQNDDRTQLTMWLEGFEDPLNVYVSRDVSQQEFEELSSDLLSNYLYHLRDKGQLSYETEDIIIINNVEFIKCKDDHTEIKRGDIKTLDSFKKIIIGFSGVDKLKNEFNKNKTMNQLNSNLLQKSYQKVEESLNLSRGNLKVRHSCRVQSSCQH